MEPLPKNNPNSSGFWQIELLKAYSIEILQFCFITRLLVGAPRAEALPLQRANRTGGLYSCDITSRGPCTRIEFDNDGGFFCPRSVFIWPAQPAPYLFFSWGRKGGDASIYSCREDLWSWLFHLSWKYLLSNSHWDEAFLLPLLTLVP